MLTRSGAIHAGLELPSGTATDPDTIITRQDAAAILGSTLPDNPDLNALSPDTSLLDPFLDNDQIKDWARDGMIKLLLMGYLKGYENARLDPGGLQWRCQALFTTRLKKLSYSMAVSGSFYNSAQKFELFQRIKAFELYLVPGLLAN